MQCLVLTWQWKEAFVERLLQGGLPAPACFPQVCVARWIAAGRIRVGTWAREWLSYGWQARLRDMGVCREGLAECWCQSHVVLQWPAFAIDLGTPGTETLGPVAGQAVLLIRGSASCAPETRGVLPRPMGNFGPRPRAPELLAAPATWVLMGGGGSCGWQSARGHRLSRFAPEPTGRMWT